MRYLTAGLLLAAAFPVLADGQATLHSQAEGQDTALEVRWAGESLRMDFPDQAQAGYLLLKDGKGYVVTEMQGQPIVMDLAMLREMAQGMAGGLPDGASAGYTDELARDVSSLEATGETETVAGIEGERYRLRWTDQSGTAHDDILVLSDNVQARELMAAFHAYQQTITGTPDPIASELEARELGLLRFGERFRIGTISDAPPPAEAFVLPEGATRLQDMLKSAISQ